MGVNLPTQRAELDRQAREIQQGINEAGRNAEVVRTGIQIGREVAPIIRDRVQTIRANQNAVNSQRITNNLRSLEGRTVAPDILPSQPALPSVDEMRQAGNEVARQRAFDRTERSAAETYRNYVNNGGLEGQRARDLAQAQARQASDRAQILEAQRYEREVLQPRFAEESRRMAEKVARDQMLEAQKEAARLAKARIDAELAKQEFERLGGRAGQEARELAQRQAIAANERLQVLEGQRRLRELAPQWAEESARSWDRAIATQMAEAQTKKAAEIAHTARLKALELANQTRRQQISVTTELLRNGSYVNEFNRLQQQQLTRMTARALNYPVDAIEAAEVARLRRPTTLDLLPDNRPARSIGKDATEGVSKEPFTNRPKPSYPTKPPIQERTPRLPDTFHPIELKVKERVRFNPLDLRPIPSDLQNGLINKTKTLLPHRPLPSNLNPALPKPWFPGFPRTNFPIRLPKGTKGNVLLDLAFDLIFPDPLNNGEDEKLREIAQMKALEGVARSHKDRGGSPEKIDYNNPNPQPLPDWDWNDPRRNADQFIKFSKKVVLYYGNPWSPPSTNGLRPEDTNTMRQAGEPIYSFSVSSATPQEIEAQGYGPYRYYEGSGENQFTISAYSGGSTTWHAVQEVATTFIRFSNGSKASFDGRIYVRVLPNSAPNPDPDPVFTPDGEPFALPSFGIDPGLNPSPDYPLEFKPNPGNPRKPDWRPRQKANQPLPPWKPWDDPSRPESMEPDPEPGSGIARQPLPTFQIFEKPKPRTQTEEQHEKECSEGGDCMTCRFNIAAIRAVVQEEINKQLASNTTVEIYDDNTGKIEKKPMAVLSLGSTADAVKLVYSELAKVREQKPVATVPDRFKTRVPDDRPQMVIVYADSKNKSYYQLVVPWAKNTKPVASKWKKGSKMVILELRDNSKIVVNAINEAEGNRVINQLKASIPADKLRDSKITTSCRKDKLKEIDVTPIRADWYEKGLAQDTPTKRYYYA